MIKTLQLSLILINIAYLVELGQRIYEGKAPGGFQLPVANAVPGDKNYSPIWQTNFVKWNDNNATARELKSVEEIIAAQKNGELTITETSIIVNSPPIKWQRVNYK